MTRQFGADAFAQVDQRQGALSDALPTPLVSVIIPVKNEEAVIPLCIARLRDVLTEQAGDSWELLFIDDGSDDTSYAVIFGHWLQDQRIRAISLSRNFGKEAALSAGLDHARGKVVVPFDVDLQDPPEAIGDMLALWREGYEVVCGIRRNRASDSWLKRSTASLYYHLHNRLSDDKIPAHAGDFRLMDRRVVDAIRQLPERNRFMKGLFAWSGFRTTSIEYERAERVAGSSKFKFWQLWTLAIDGITASSTAPLRIWSYIGAIVALFALAYAGFIVARTLIFGSPISGYPSLIVSVMFLGGVQLLSLGVLGEYVGRILTETKQRPLYIVRDKMGF